MSRPAAEHVIVKYAACFMSLMLFACLPAVTESGADAGPELDAATGSDAASGTDTGGTGQDAATGVDHNSGGTDAAAGVDTQAPVGVELNAGWIGGACSSASDCGDVTDGVCQTSGFPAGMCTLPCDVICPDAASFGAGTGFTVTRCIVDEQGQGQCVAGCDFDQSPSGCRPGYTCVLRQRDGQPNSLFPVCLPGDVQRWPGESAPANDIGEACSADTDCAHLSCLDLPGGYCSKSMCNVAGCPSGSTCFGLGNNGETACIQDCGQASDCRVSEGYTCDSDNVCWVEQTAPPPSNWDPSVGTADCADALSAGLSPCDLIADDYIVINKSARNVALCNAGSLVTNYHMGITPAPRDSGDKVREGDGLTPEGVFYVAAMVPNSQYYKAFLFSYPDSEDAARGLRDGLINQQEHDDIIAAQQSCSAPPQTTTLGSYLELHGEFPGYDWTLGCVSVTNNEMDELWLVIEEDDTIVIKP